MSHATTPVIRSATEADLPLILELIEGLADYERLRHECRATIPLLRDSLFGPHPAAEVLIAEHEGVPAGFALYFHNYSTFLAQRGIYLEDLFVKPAFRGRGIGHALLVRLAQVAIERQCGRLEWAVLDWNESAIGFYQRLGAKPMVDWTVFRLADTALARLAAESS
jgi:GNAT superfamily N-acetyltransferase